MAKILNKCLVCGGRLQCSNLMQFTKDYQIKLNGRLSKNSKNSDVSPVGCGFISCTSCSFHTNCDLEVEENYNIKIYQENEVYMYDER